MTLQQLERLLAGETVGIKNGNIYIEGNCFVVEEKIEVGGEITFAIEGYFEDLESALKRMSLIEYLQK